MSQVVLDEQLDVHLRDALSRWTTVSLLTSLCPHEHVLDDRVPSLLLRLNQPTFITIDGGFWKRRLCHPGYCIVYFSLTDNEQTALPSLLRDLVRFPEFHTRASRMGKVVRVSTVRVDYWERQSSTLRHIVWPRRRRR
jgi:hypothetical protein